LARQARSSAGYTASLGAFNSVLNDGHAALRAPQAEAVGWPGFITAWRGGELQVFDSTVEVPAKGDRVLSCDGNPIRELVTRNVFAFAVHNGEASAWWLLAPRVFFDAGNPFVKRPQHCTFATASGPQRRQLAWSAVSSERLASLYSDVINGDRLPIGLSERGRGIFWVALPTFAPNDAERQELQRLFTDLDAKREDLLRGRAVVLDLRHNRGGSSQWCVDTAAHLWGEAPVQGVLETYFRGVQVWWRATSSNTAELEKYARKSREQGEVEGAAQLEALTAAMRQAELSNQPFVIEPAGGSSDMPPATPPAALAVPVYVIVPAQCASACLDALDLFTRFPDVTLIGAPSATDTTYLDTRTEPLPSGKSQAVIPMKVWVGRPRASGEGYEPAIEVSELEWSTQTFLRRIEAHLQTRGVKN